MANRRLTKKDLYERPIFSIKMAALFFDLSAASIRRLQSEGIFTDDYGVPIIPRDPLALSEPRRFSLSMIAQMAHAMRRSNRITNRQLRTILARVEAFSRPVKGKKPE